MTGHVLHPPRAWPAGAGDRLLEVRARLRAPSLDRHLAAGVPPSRTPLHHVRARQLTERRRRAALADALDRLVAEAHDRPAVGGVRVPVWLRPVPERSSVLGCESQLADLSVTLREGETLSAHTVAALHALLDDTGGPLYCTRHTGELARALHRIARAAAVPD